MAFLGEGSSWAKMVSRFLQLCLFYLFFLNRWNCFIRVWEIESIPHSTATVQKDIIQRWTSEKRNLKIRRSGEATSYFSYNQVLQSACNKLIGLFVCADLPPPPEPPPAEGTRVDLGAMSKARAQPPSREWRADQRMHSQWSTEGLKTYYTLTNRVSHPSCNWMVAGYQINLKRFIQVNPKHNKMFL